MARRKNYHALARRVPKREPYARVLIVCEGEKTEPNYLQELIDHHQLSSANVQIFGDGGSAPGSVVEYAIEIFEHEPDYEYVFCVFDRDKHATFDAAVQRIRDKTLIRRDSRGKKAGAARFDAITSIPCFEYWVLLHFVETTAEMPRFANVLPRLRKFPELNDYDKGARGLFEKLQGRLEQALKRADRANKAAQAAATDNPTTRMPELIRYLLKLAKDKIR